MNKFLLFLVTFLGCQTALFATHNRAGEITFRRIYSSSNPNSFKYEATVITYTRLPANQIPDRCELEIVWGDGTLDTIPRVNGVSSSSCAHSGEVVAADIKKNIYVGLHTYAGPSCFTISVTDPNRNASVINIPNSTNVSFYIESQLCINPFLGFNNTSPVLLNPPIDNACTCKKFVHNPGAFDADGDSLSYELIDCKDAGGNPIFGYTLPPGVTINATTGDMVWQCPNPIGEFNFAILIKEWRQGSLIGSVERDLQVTVVGGCQNDPPVIAALKDTCVVAGTTIAFPVTATDPNFNDEVTLTSTGGVYLLSSSPAFFPQGAHANTTVTATFSWQTNCSHVRLQPYQVLFKAEDNDLSTPLVDIKTVNLTVIAPAPQNLIASPIGTSIQLNWQQELCSNAIGYKIYRKNSPSGFVPSNCITGIPAFTGFIEIATVTGITSTSFTDSNNGNGLINGLDYCYMIYAYFADGSKSYASNEICVQLNKDAPVITHVDVVETNSSNGKIQVKWSKPTEIDTIAFPGPYFYKVFRASNGNFQLQHSTQVAIGLNDTTFLDIVGLNTLEEAYTYKIEVYSTTPTTTFISNSSKASSVFLTLIPNDNQLQLNWQSTVPWHDSIFVIYKQNELVPTQYDSIGTTTGYTFIDTGLINGRTYCYKIKAIGTYSTSGLVSPLINFSQIACGIPQDKTAPCAPGNFGIATNCDLIQNTLTWNNPNNNCADDVVAYKIYYTPVLDEAMSFLQLINDANELSFSHNNNGVSIAGCYAIAAVDSFGNEGPMSDSVCIDNCPNYELPNIVTIDDDGKNDFFIPFPYKFVESINLDIYNRWGQLVYHTEDPKIGWDGTNQKSKQLVPDGVYYYVCEVNEIRLTGIEPRTIKGFLHVFTSQQKNGAK